MTLEMVQPEGWDAPSGYANGVVVPPGARLVLVAGQIAWDARRRLVGPGDFTAQFRQALANVLAVVAAAGGRPQDLASCTVFVKDKRAYLGATRELGAAWRELVGKHYPAMALVEVRDLVEEGALIEIQAIAAIDP
jgi:enamine deaminase RidA (YjgF/YER057c/UK114 family)